MPPRSLALAAPLLLLAWSCLSARATIPSLLFTPSATIDFDHALPGQRHGWKRRTTMPFPRSDMTTTTLDNGIYIFGGCVQNQTYNVALGFYMCGDGVTPEVVTNSALYYDPIADQYNTLPSLPRRRFRHSACAYNRSIYLMGGVDISDNIITVVDVFDVDHQTYTSTLILPNATSDPGAFCIPGDGVYFMGGYDRPNFISHADVYRFDPLQPHAGFKPVAPMKQNRGDLGYAMLNGLGYAFGGWTSDDNFTTPLGSIEIYYQGQWFQETEPAYFARADFAVGTYLDRIFFFGGENKLPSGLSIPINEVERYWPIDGGIWTKGGEQLTKRYRHMGASWGSSIFLFGGQRYLEGAPFTAGSYYPLAIECDEYYEILSQDMLQNILLQLHGAGTKSNEPWFQHVLSLLQSRTRMPILMSYRHLTSGFANLEFINAANYYEPQLDWYSTDLPLSSAQFAEITNAGHQIFHIPLALNKVAVFINVPGLNNQLNLTACLLARIMTGNISFWNDSALVNLIPSLSSVLQRIVVARQPDGSMLTWALSAYLNNACPSSWTLPVSATLGPLWNNSVLVSQATMTAFVMNTSYSIGYDSQLVPGLTEVALINKNGNVLLSAQANATVNAQQVTLPPPGSDYSSVVLINSPGALAWPMVTCNYLLVRGDWTGYGQVGALFQAFLAFLTSTEGKSYAASYTTTQLPPSWQAVQNQVIANITWPYDLIPFAFESTTPNITWGSAWNTISAARGVDSYQTTSTLQAQLASTQAQATALAAQVTALQNQLANLQQTGAISSSSDSDTFGIAVAGLVIACLALVLAGWVVFDSVARSQEASNAAKLDLPPFKPSGAATQPSGAVEVV